MELERIKDLIKESIELKQRVAESEEILSDCQFIIEILQNLLAKGKKILLCGNGGSAADALHLAAEFSGRFYLDRKALPVEALSVNMAAVTAISNDFGFEHLYARMLESKGSEGDVLWVLSTSGSSPNIINAAKKAKELNIKVIAFTGKRKTELDDLCDRIIKIPSTDTPRIQECHLLLGHIICEQVEKYLFNE